MPVGDGFAVDGANDVADAEAGLQGGTGGLDAVGAFEGLGDVADAGGGGHAAFRQADDGDDAGENKREEHVERRAGDEDEHSRGVGNGREFRDVGRAFAFDRTEVGELREEHVAAERKPRDAVFDAVFRSVGPDGRTETDGETLDEHTATAGGEKVA